MIPYIYIPTTKLFGFIPIQPFGLLVGLGIIFAYWLSRRRATETGLDAELCGDAIVWIAIAGFIVGHLVSVIFYYPHRIAENPLVLLAFWDGLSSFGGVMGGIAGAIVFFRRRRVAALPYIDAIIFGTVPGWVLGRAGCAVVHDHPGAVTNFFLAVHCETTCPSAYWSPGVTRHDLGLYEMLFLIALSGVLFAVKRLRPFYGFHPALVLFLYAPARFAFDYLRVEDKTYFGWTPGQYIAAGFFLFSFLLVVNGLRLRRRGFSPATAVPVPPSLAPTQGRPSAHPSAHKDKGTKRRK